VVVLASLVYAIRENAAPTPLAQPVLTQPAGVNSYLKAHANTAKAMAVEPAVVSVTSYLNMHRIASNQQSDVATQGVKGYLLAHATWPKRP
jgi:hypothetical protein